MCPGLAGLIKKGAFLSKTSEELVTVEEKKFTRPKKWEGGDST